MNKCGRKCGRKGIRINIIGSVDIGEENTPKQADNQYHLSVKRLNTHSFCKVY